MNVRGTTGFPPAATKAQQPRFQSAPPVFTPITAQAAQAARSARQNPNQPLNQLIAQLGTRTQIHMNGLVQFNEPLIESIKAYREQALPALYNFLSTVHHIPALLEGLYTAEEMAEAGIQNVASLYPAVSRWNTNPDPLVQIYLAGFYREIKIPTTFGPMLSTLMNTSVNKYPLQSSPTYNITEEVGGTILQQIADTTADEVMKRLTPFIQPPAGQRPR